MHPSACDKLAGTPGQHSPSNSRKFSPGAAGITAACSVFAYSHTCADGQNNLRGHVVTSICGLAASGCLQQCALTCEREASHVHMEGPAFLLVR